MKRLISLLLMLVMCVTILTPTQVKEAQAAETISVSTWAIPDLIYGDTYGTYPQSWYEKDLTASIDQGKFRTLLYGVRRKLVYSDCAVEKRFEDPMVDSSLTVKEALEAFYTLLSNYDYTVDLGLTYGMDAVTYMKTIGVYTGQNGEQGLDELCSIEQAMVIATRIVTVVYEALDASSKGFLWEVKSGENTVYLLGSIHIASSQIYPFSSEIWTAFNNAEALIAEVNFFDQADYAALAQLMVYTDGTTLKDHVSEDTYKKAIEAAALIGIPEEMAMYYKPWALMLTFESYVSSDTEGTDQTSAQLGIDMYLETSALIYQKPIYAIEGLEEQGLIFDSFSEELLDYILNEDSAYLCDIINGVAGADKTETDEYMDALFEAWRTGDIEAFTALTTGTEDSMFTGELSEEEKAYYEEYQLKIMTQRDDGMAAYIDNLLKAEGSHTYFVVVGSAHYISDYSVIDRLEKMGYEVNQVK